jgi:hypothetical protein
MQTKKFSVARRVSVLILLTFSLNSLAEYVEGIDTTDINCYGLDSAFKIGAFSALDIVLTGQKLACYSGMGYYSTIGAYKYAFDEINLAADSIFFSSNLVNNGSEFYYPKNNFCFVIQKYKDSTFFKVQILNRLGDNRYVYKFGTNKTPKNRMMVRSDYDRAVRYKPNNLFYRFYGGQKFSWEPPLPNDNHLQGYIVYIQKKGSVIDTNASINLAQWDSVGFTDSTAIQLNFDFPGAYFNIVAVYTEGKSDFLKGWTRLYRPDYIKREENSFSNFNIFSYIVKHRKGLFEFNFPMMVINLVIFNPAGRQKAHFSNFTGSRMLWNSSQHNIPPGLYLLRAEFPDRSAVTQPFTIAR